MRPMLATPGSLPTGPDWTFECKWDGMRLLAEVTDRVRLRTRNGNDASMRFPELADLVGALNRAGHREAILDGELIATGADGGPSFARLSHRIQTTGARLRGDIPVTYVVFDLLSLDDEDLRPMPYVERRALLEGLSLDCDHVVVAETYEDGEALFSATREQGLEGVVAKRKRSSYQPGVRSRDWVKVPHRETHEFVVIGWRPERSGTRRVGSLALAALRDGDWRFTGAAGSGLSGELSDALGPVLDSIAAEPHQQVEGLPADFLAVEPHLVVEVAHMGHGADGLLRHPAVVRLRPDLTAADLAGEGL